MKQLASYWKVSLSAAYKWGDETVHKKTIIMQSGAEPQIIKLIGEISQLCYVFDCQNIKATARAKTAKLEFDSDVAHLKIYQPDGRCVMSLVPIDLNASTAVAELQKVKSTLESFIY
jgi:hypothetical protein